MYMKAMDWKRIHVCLSFVVILAGLGINDLFTGMGMEPGYTLSSDGEDSDEEEGPILFIDVSCGLFAFVHSIKFLKTRLVFESSLSKFFGVVVRGIALGTGRGSEAVCIFIPGSFCVSLSGVSLCYYRRLAITPSPQQLHNRRSNAFRGRRVVK